MRYLAFRPTLLAWLLSVCLSPVVVHAASLPVKGSVVAGSATIEDDGVSRMRIAQHSDRALIQWDIFDIGEHGRVDILQPSRDALLVNRVMGEHPSHIAGALRANGSLVLVNPNGIHLRSTATVEASNFLGSGIDITEQEIDTLAQAWKEQNPLNPHDPLDGLNQHSDGTQHGKQHLKKRVRTGAVALVPGRHTVFPQIATDSQGAFIINHGRIRVREGGHVGLLGAHVKHTGAIIADGGHISIAGLGHRQADISNAFQDSPLGGPLEGFQANPQASLSPEATVTVSGLLRANTITPGVHERQLPGILQDKVYGTGRIAIDGRDGAVAIEGTVVATVEQEDNRGAGGDIAITGRHVRLHQALIDVLGATSGGRISLATQGPYPGLQRIDVNQGSSLLAQGTGAGNGGDIHITSAGQTVFDGAAVVSGDRSALREIYASGVLADSGVFGRRSSVTPLGEGGSVVLVGLNSLVVGGEIDASSARGARKGTVLFDAGEALVGKRQTRSRLAGAVMPRMGVIDADTLASALTGADVTIVARGQNEFGKRGSIYVGSPVIWHTDSALTLKAAGDVSVHDTIRGTGRYATFTRHAGRPLLQTAGGNGDNHGKLTMTGEHGSLRSLGELEVPSALPHPNTTFPRSSPKFTYSVAAPARLEQGRLASPSLQKRSPLLSGDRGRIRQVVVDATGSPRPELHRLLTDAALLVPGTPNDAGLRSARAMTDEQRTRAEALAVFRGDSPAESMVRSLVHVQLGMHNPGEIDESEEPL